MLDWDALWSLQDVQFGKSVLHEAISFDLAPVALAILGRGDFYEVNSRTANGSTALHWAAFRGFVDVCQSIGRREDFNQLLADSNYFGDG